MDETQQDIDAAAEHQQQQIEQSRRERELLDRAVEQHAELERLAAEADASIKRIRWAIDRIFHPERVSGAYPGFVGPLQRKRSTGTAEPNGRPAPF